MTSTQRQIRAILAVLMIAQFGALTLVQALRAQEIRRQLQVVERQIARATQTQSKLEAEYSALTRQDRLNQLNIDYGFAAPAPEQYVGSERELAAWSMPDASAPPPIRYASAGDAPAPSQPFPAMVQAAVMVAPGGAPPTTRLAQAHGADPAPAVVRPVRKELTFVAPRMPAPRRDVPKPGHAAGDKPAAAASRRHALASETQRERTRPSHPAHGLHPARPAQRAAAHSGSAGHAGMRPGR